MEKAFDPLTSYTLATGIVSANLAIDKSQNSIYVHNDSASTAFVVWGGGAQTAVTTGSCVSLPANSVQVFSKGNADNVAAILISGTGNLRVTVGEGF